MRSTFRNHGFAALAVAFWFGLAADIYAAQQGSPAALRDGQPVKAVLGTDSLGPNLLRADGWRGYEQGFQRDGEVFVCDNGEQPSARRGVLQHVVLDQQTPEPIVAIASSKAEGVTGSADNDYSLYLDLVYQDGTPLWGQAAAFDTGTHDWQQRRVIVVPEKPVKSLTFYLLFRRHGGRAYFRQAQLHVIAAPEGACLFAGVPVRIVARAAAGGAGFQLRDVGAGSDFVHIEQQALGLKLRYNKTDSPQATIFEATLADTTGKDRAVTLLYSVYVPCEVERPVPGPDGRFEHVRRRAVWLQDPRRSEQVAPGREYCHATRFGCGSTGQLSLYPLGAVVEPGPGSGGRTGVALGIDMARPAFYRIGYNAATEELFLAYDIGLTPEKPTATVRFCLFRFEPSWGFRSALAGYYELFPDAFRCRTPEQGLWMPFARISQVKQWQDFGFKFKEGNDETAWDDAHNIITFRYTEPMTWWMPMPKDMPRTVEAALAEAKRLAGQGNRQALALLSSGFHDRSGRFPARLLDTPWCNGAVWSMNSMPGVPGEVTDFKNKWNQKLIEQFYGPGRKGDLDGEYIDSSEGYVTDELNFRREHFSAAETPLVFCIHTHRPAIFRGLVAFEYVRAIAKDVHGMGKLMMANGTPTGLCWLCPMLEVLGTETNWNPGGRWRPMSDAELLYRRALCKGKPYCFLMNTEFERFGPELVEKYMKRCLAYGMFPGFFSHNASEGHYFRRPELYERDRPLFKKYVPLCKRVAEAGWEPITLARCGDEKVYVERFGDRYLTVFNDSPQRRTAVIALEGISPAGTECAELVRGGRVLWKDGQTQLRLDGEDVAVIDLLAK